jgi:hypothetical protein
MGKQTDKTKIVLELGELKSLMLWSHKEGINNVYEDRFKERMKDKIKIMVKINGKNI